LIFGNEVYGVSQSAIELCDGCIEIPQTGTKHSLNISVSAGIVVWEFFQNLITKYFKIFLNSKKFSLLYLYKMIKYIYAILFICSQTFAQKAAEKTLFQTLLQYLLQLEIKFIVQALP
jgi:tRNA C32,U32 (ribose-2'-O)-methylase TrmJ